MFLKYTQYKYKIKLNNICLVCLTKNSNHIMWKNVKNVLLIESNNSLIVNNSIERLQNQMCYKYDCVNHENMKYNFKCKLT